MNAELKPGDTVCVKSGGAVMTITSIEDDAGTLTASCVWHDGKRKMEGTFPVVSLVKVEQPSTKSAWAAIGKTRVRLRGTKPRLPRFVQLIPPGAAE